MPSKVIPKNKLLRSEDFIPVDKGKIAKRNKQRGNVMERRVMAFLNGARTPMSGAGLYKGDGVVFLGDSALLIECKSKEPISGDKVIFTFNESWIPKLYNDVAAMRGLGVHNGLFVIHYHGYSEDYALIPSCYSFSHGFDVQGTVALKTAYLGLPLPRQFMKDTSKPFLLQTSTKVYLTDFVVCTLAQLKKVIEDGCK